MNERRRGGHEIVEGLLIAFLGAPIVGTVVAVLLLIATTQYGLVFTLASFATFAYGAFRAARGARVYFDNVETAALLAIGEAETSSDQQSQG